MTKTFAAIALATLVASAAAPAFASDGSEIANAQVQSGQVQPGYVALSDGMHAYASVRGANWHHAQGASAYQQEQNQWALIDR